MNRISVVVIAVIASICLASPSTIWGSNKGSSNSNRSNNGNSSDSNTSDTDSIPLKTYVGRIYREGLDKKYQTIDALEKRVYDLLTKVFDIPPALDDFDTLVAIAEVELQKAYVRFLQLNPTQLSDPPKVKKKTAAKDPAAEGKKNLPAVKTVDISDTPLWLLTETMYNHFELNSTFNSLSDWQDHVYDVLDRNKIFRGKDIPDFETLCHYPDEDYIHKILITLDRNVDAFIPEDAMRVFITKEIERKQAEDSKNSGAQARKEKKNVSYESYLNRIKHFLEEGSVGQPEAIEKLLDIEKQTIAAGPENARSQVLILMGPDNRGKLSLAKAYVDGIHEEPAAWKTHLFAIQTPIKDRMDIGTLMGSGTGYIGSDQIPPLIEFLVNHSGGRYMIATERSPSGKGDRYIVENPNWTPGTVLDGFSAPKEGVIFISNFGKWSMKAKDEFLLGVLNGEGFKLRNPGKGGVHTLHVNVNFIIATDEGLNLIVARDRDGNRVGKPLNFDKMKAKWEVAHNNSTMLRDQLISTNALGNPNNPNEADPGISEGLALMIPDSSLHLNRPLSPDDLRKIIKQQLELWKQMLETGKNNSFPKVKITWDDSVIEFVRTYDFLEEQNAEGIEARVETLVVKPMLDLIFAKKTKLEDNQDLKLSITENPDKTKNLVVESAKLIADGKNNASEIIPATLKERDVERLSETKRDHILTLKERMKKHVVNVDHILDAIQEKILVSEDGRTTGNNPNDAHSARILMFLGLSSTGKTEIAKALGREHYKSDTFVIDFSKIQSQEAVDHIILGYKDGNGRPVKSDLMNAYDRTNGNLILVFDEASNANPVFLTRLYDLFREPVVTNFVDGKPRAMTNVMIIMTGNAGQEWFLQIPRDVPFLEQMKAMEEIYSEAASDSDFRRKFLEKTFSPALLNRIGIDNIYFFSPLSYEAVRNLADLKLRQSMDRLTTDKGNWWWKVGFLTPEDYVDMIRIIEGDGFVLWEQGASIARFVSDSFEGRLKYFLLKNKIPKGAEIALRVPSEPEHEGEEGQGQRSFDVEVLVKGHKEPLIFTMNGRIEDALIGKSPLTTYLTAVHEAGHEVSNEVVRGDIERPEGISIVPGVTKIDDQWIRYAGLAKRRPTKSIPTTREAVISRMVVLVSGDIAQSLVTVGDRGEAGKSNDYMRATSIAENAILRWGLSPAWGAQTMPDEMEVQDYLASLTEERRALFEKELHAFLEEAELLSRKLLTANLETVVAMASDLAVKGELDGDEIKEVYEKVGTKLKKDVKLTQMDFVKARAAKIARKLKSKLTTTSHTRDAELKPGFKLPENVIDPDTIIESERIERLSDVDVSRNAPVVTDPAHFSEFIAAPETHSDSDAIEVIQAAIGCGEVLAVGK